MKLRISSRQSELAQAQAYEVAGVLKKQFPELQVDLLFRESLGDKNLTDPLWRMPEKGVFTEDFYRDLANAETDVVVHSWKDLPTEEKPDTWIAASLPRADQRDFLIFKETSRNKNKLQIYSSSPRRAHNLQDFFSWALPWKTEEIQFQSVRGNIPTRIRKLLAAEEIDGLILAKAAMDRLLEESRFPETQSFLRQVLENCHWMVLPLTANPNAAAQGALAIEIKRGRPEIERLVSAVNSKESFETASRERELLKSFGGGCHLALGMSCLKRDYGQIEIVRGKTPDGSLIAEQRFIPTKKLPLNIERIRLEFSAERKLQSVSIPSDINALYVTKSEAWGGSFPGLVWASGLETWKKLAGKGVWVSGSSEGLGENEDPMIQAFFSTPLSWGRIGHQGVSPDESKQHFATYHLDLSLQSGDIHRQGAYLWKSPQEFDLAVAKNPNIRSQIHVCGPGRTYRSLVQRLGSDKNIFVELNDDFKTVL